MSSLSRSIDEAPLAGRPVLPIIWDDACYIAINKPSGLLVHPTELAPGEDSCLKVLRDQIGLRLYPVHRLDRQTSGVLIFAKSSDAARALMTSWPEGNVRKSYQAIVRGWTAEEGLVDRPLRETPEKPRVPAQTRYRRERVIELPDPVGRYTTARYSWVRVETLTGRQHQVRKHLLSISHPIVGDTTYGDGDHNRYFRAKFGIHRLLLHADTVEFGYPGTGAQVALAAAVPTEFARVFAPAPPPA
jgi:tRNA pseudouridine65 synthase